MLAETKLKTFWEKPEGKTGMIVSALLLGGGLIGFVKLLPWMIALATNTLHLIFLLAAIGGILFLVTNGQVRALAGVTFQLLMKKFTSFIVKTDPLAILKLKVREMESNLEGIAESLTKLAQNMNQLGRKISTNTNSMKAEMERASYAKKQGENEAIYLATRQAGRLQKSNMTLQELYNKIQQMHRVLTKIHKNSAVVITDTKNEIDVTETEYTAVKAAHSAMKSAMNLLNGNKDRRAIYEEAYETLYTEISDKSGELQQMLEMSDSLMKNIDLDQGMLQEQGMKMLDAWEKKADSWLVTSSQKTDALSKASGQTIPHQLSPEVEQVVQNTNNQFSNLFK